jgi:molybdopterin/thiamine biosynthesis adenylyltransferase
MEADRYDRQRRIEGWDQAALLQARVLVAGAGALGNELIKNLALLGV